MKLYVSGSPRVKTCYKIIKDIMTVEDAFFPIKELNINSCSGCQRCEENLNNRCIMQDDMENIYDNIEKFDTIVIVSPIYYNQVTALTKKFIERLNPFCETEKLKKTKLLLILSGKIEENENKDVIESINKYFNDICEIFKMNFMGTHYFNTDDLLKPFYIDKIMNIKNMIYEK